MTYLVTDNCVKCKMTDCVSVCPVDCFYEGENFLAINPDECIDCGICEPECPVGAITPDIALAEDERNKWHDINLIYSTQWPRLTQKKEPMENWEQFDKMPDKYKQFFSPNPGTGDE